MLVLVEEGRGQPVTDCSRPLTCLQWTSRIPAVQTLGEPLLHYGLLSECSNHTHIRPLAILPLEMSLSASCVFLPVSPCWCCVLCGRGEVSQSLTAARAPAVPPAALQLRALCNARGKLCAQQQTPAAARALARTSPRSPEPHTCTPHRDVRSNYF